MVEYTGHEGTLEIDDVAFALSEFTVRVVRNVASHARSGHWSALKLPGTVDVTGTLSRIMIDGQLLGYVIGDTEETGAAGTLHAGLSAPGAGAETVTDMTTTNAQNSLIKLTALTAAVTAAGKCILYGTDINGNPLTEIITVTTMGINETITGTKIFATVTHAVLFDYVQAGGTMQVASVAGASGIVVGAGKLFKLEGMATSGSSHVYVTAENCFLTDGEFSFTDADTIMSDTLSWTMKDPDADLNITYVA